MSVDKDVQNKEVTATETVVETVEVAEIEDKKANTQAVKAGVLDKLAKRYGFEKAVFYRNLLLTIKDQVGSLPEHQLAAYLVLLDRHNLNPFSGKELYLMKQGGKIQFVLGVDGWTRVINDNPLVDGINFNFSETMEEFKVGNRTTKPCHTWVECIIYRKDRNHPTTIREYGAECVRNSQLWADMPNRMLRHKSLIQAARVALGLSEFSDEFDLSIEEEKPQVAKKSVEIPIEKFIELAASHNNWLAVEATLKSRYKNNDNLEDALRTFNNAKEAHAASSED